MTTDDFIPQNYEFAILNKSDVPATDGQTLTPFCLLIF